jgi:putative hydrolase of the HAD superfamily
MKLRAIVFDIYGTLLHVGPPPPDAEQRWEDAWTALGTSPPLKLAAFEAACRRVVAREHDAARRRGISFPEVFWPDIVNAVVTGLAAPLGNSAAAVRIQGAEFLHTVELAPGAAAILQAARHAGLRVGLASNCQPYSLAELGGALQGAGLSLDLFDPLLRFLSFENGFSKPDPHVFRFLTARLRRLGIEPGEAMMVGDRADNDLEPARACGWQVLNVGGANAGGWAGLRDQLFNP